MLTKSRGFSSCKHTRGLDMFTLQQGTGHCFRMRQFQSCISSTREALHVNSTQPHLRVVAAGRETSKLRIWDDLRQLAAVSEGHQGIVLAVHDQHLQPR